MLPPLPWLSKRSEKVGSRTSRDKVPRRRRSSNTWKSKPALYELTLPVSEYCELRSATFKATRWPLLSLSRGTFNSPNISFTL